MANLRIPGPTPLPAQVLSSLSQQVISHRGKSFEKVYQDVVANLQYFPSEDEITFMVKNLPVQVI